MSKILKFPLQPNIRLNFESVCREVISRSALAAGRQSADIERVVEALVVVATTKWTNNGEIGIQWPEDHGFTPEQCELITKKFRDLFGYFFLNVVAERLTLELGR